MTAADPTLGGLLGPLPKQSDLPPRRAPRPAVPQQRPGRAGQVLVPDWVVDRTIDLLEHAKRGDGSRDDDAQLLAQALRQARGR